MGSPSKGGNPKPPPVNPSALKSGSVLLRLAHIYAIDEGGELSLPAIVDLQNLFTAWKIESMIEYSLSVLQPLTQMHRIRWRTNDTNPKGAGRQALKIVPSSTDGTKVTIGPMDIRTFVITLTPRLTPDI